jgi:hypothetical protein
MTFNKKEYLKKYREKNKEKLKEYWLNNKERLKEYHKKYWLNNKEKNKKYQKKYREKNKEKLKEYWLNNKERLKEYHKKYNVENNKKRKEYQKKYREENREKKLKDGKEHYLKNREKIIKQNGIYSTFKRRTDINWALRSRLRCRIRAALRGNVKSKRTMELLGVPHISFFKTWLECKFKEGMTWENRYLWHIDHIKPCSSFDLTKPEEQAECFHYTNLQPLWASENLSKGNRIS